LVIALKIAKQGYYQGDLDKVLKARCDHVLLIAQYEKFIADFEKAYSGG
jgi:hypothetical protein